jgi:hypothetical protein
MPMTKVRFGGNCSVKTLSKINPRKPHSINATLSKTLAAVEYANDFWADGTSKMARMDKIPPPKINPAQRLGTKFMKTWAARFFKLNVHMSLA